MHKMMKGLGRNNTGKNNIGLNSNLPIGIPVALVGMHHSKMTDTHGPLITLPVAPTDPIPVLAKNGLDILAKEHGKGVNRHMLLHGTPLPHMAVLKILPVGSPPGGKNLNVDDGDPRVKVPRRANNMEVQRDSQKLERRRKI